MGEQAVALAKAVNYQSAGTVEFVVGLTCNQRHLRYSAIRIGIEQLRAVFNNATVLFWHKAWHIN